MGGEERKEAPSECNEGTSQRGGGGADRESLKRGSVNCLQSLVGEKHGIWRGNQGKGIGSLGGKKVTNHRKRIGM